MAMKIVHHMDFGPAYSGLDSRVYSMFKAGNATGGQQERYIHFTNTPHPMRFLFHGQVYKSISHDEALAMKDGAVNIFHRHLPEDMMEYSNRVFFAHGQPQYVTEKLESIEAVSEYFQKCDIVLTSWKSHIDYWKLMTNKPIFYNIPGVDLEYFTPNCPKADLPDKTVLWLDAWRGCSKQPWNLLYAIKMLKPHGYRLKMVNIPDFNRAKLTAMIKALGIEDILVGEIEDMHTDVRPLYRGAHVVYCAGGVEGNNISWEATACGARIVTEQSPQAISYSIKRLGGTRAHTYDVMDTVIEQQAIFHEAFGL